MKNNKAPSLQIKKLELQNQLFTHEDHHDSNQITINTAKFGDLIKSSTNKDEKKQFKGLVKKRIDKTKWLEQAP